MTKVLLVPWALPVLGVLLAPLGLQARMALMVSPAPSVPPAHAVALVKPALLVHLVPLASQVLLVHLALGWICLACP